MNELSIRLVEADDFAELFNVIERNRARLLTFFPETSQSITSEETAARLIQLKLKHIARKEQFYYVIQLPGRNEIIGLLILKNINWNVPKGELAYFIDGQYEGRGFITYAVKWLVNFAFNELKMEKLFIKVNPQNWGSRKVAIKNGFEMEGLLRCEFRTGDGELTDVEQYGLVKSLYGG